MIWFDMDGVLAKWNMDASIEDTHTPGYFLEREPESGAVELIKSLAKEGSPVGIRSAAYKEGTARQDKEAWLKKQGLSTIPLVFTEYGGSKTAGLNGTNHVLIDDFSANLHDWEKSGYTGVKFYNGINGTHGTWSGYSIDHRMPVEKMAVIIKAIHESALKDIKKSSDAYLKPIL